VRDGRADRPLGPFGIKAGCDGALDYLATADVCRQTIGDESPNRPPFFVEGGLRAFTRPTNCAVVDLVEAYRSVRTAFAHVPFDLRIELLPGLLSVFASATSA
jgi:hypothetical protein